MASTPPSQLPSTTSSGPILPALANSVQQNTAAAAGRLTHSIATCSPLLATIMELSPNPGAVYLNHISIKNLNLILDFMYTGEANVDNEDLNEFLAAASTLKVMGLTENSAEMDIGPEEEIKNEEL